MTQTTDSGSKMRIVTKQGNKTIKTKERIGSTNINTNHRNRKRKR